MSASTYPIFTTAAVRDAAIPHPSQGDTCVISTGTGAGLYTYAGPITGWQQPWNQPWGEVVYSALTTAFVMNDVPVTGKYFVSPLNVVFTPVVNRQYRIELEGSITGQIDGSGVRVMIQDDWDGSIIFDVNVNYGTSGTARQNVMMSKHLVLQPPPGVQASFTIVALLLIGTTGSIYGDPLRPMSLRVLDVGPSGAPV